MFHATKLVIMSKIKMKLRYLHLSDLHIGYAEMRGDTWATEAFNQDIVIQSMLEALRNLIRENNYFDFIILTGDIARKGKSEEYLVAEIFVKSLLKVTCLPQERLYLIPGNHDVNRAEIKKFHLNLYNFNDQNQINDLLIEPESLDIFTRKFRNFNEFAEKAMGRRHFDSTTFQFSEALELEKHGQRFKFNLLGLNSCLFAGYDGDDQQKLALSLYQVHRAINQLDENALFSIGYLHHPFSTFHPVDEVCKNRLLQKLDIIHTGHVHKAYGYAFQSTSGEAVVIGAGASYESRTSKNSFNVVEIELATGSAKVQSYKYLPDHHLWKVDTDFNPVTSDDYFHFTISSIQLVGGKKAVSDPPEEFISTKVVPKIRFIHDYLLPNNFTGREKERERVKHLIQGMRDSETNKSVSLSTVRAPGGVGKSCMIRKVIEEFRGESRFSHIVWFSFYEARTEDENYFLHRVLEELDIGPILVGEAEGSLKTQRLRERLCSHLNRTPILLVLDGLEVIQHTEDYTSKHYGKIKTEYNETGKLLSHLCNQRASMALVTSRVPLTQYSGVSGYLEIPLDYFQVESGAKLLERLGVHGSWDSLLRCSKMIGGHVLCLKAAGIYMKLKKIPATEVEIITDDLEVFEKSTEGERLTKILSSYKNELTPDQKHFLVMLSLHPLSVTESNFTVLVKGYDPSQKDRILENIILPLQELGLIEVLTDVQGTVSYSTHPLIKLGISTWIDDKERKRAHEYWADMSITSPDILYDVSDVRDIEGLQPYLDVIEHYLKAGNYKEAWSLYRGRNLDVKLFELGYMYWLTNISEPIEEALKCNNLDMSLNDKTMLFNHLAQAYYRTHRHEESHSCFQISFAAAEQMNDAGKVLRDGAILAQNYLRYGRINKARKQLNQLKNIAENEQSKETEALSLYREAEARLELYSGNYIDAISLFPEPQSREYYSVRNLLHQNCYLAESLIRSGKITEAESLLFQSLKNSERYHVNIHIPEMYNLSTMLMLKLDNIPEAREYNDKRNNLLKWLNLHCEDNGFLLVAEGHFDQALRVANSYISNSGEDKFDKVCEIENLLVIAQAWHGNDQVDKAQMYLNRAINLMEETGCWREKDRLEITRKIID